MPTPYHVRLAVSQYGEQFRAELFTEDLGDTEGDLLTELPPSIAEWVPYLAQGADLPPDAARQLGKDLFAALLGQAENAKKWAEVLTQAARNKQPIRLLIDATTEAVRDLPYGLLCEPHDDWFLFREGRQQSVEFVRILRRCSPRPLKLRDRLRVLIAVAEPKSADVPPFDAALRLQKLAAALHKVIELVVCGPDGLKAVAEIAPNPEAADPATFAPFTRTTRAALRKALAGEYDAFHLLAHGHGAGVLLCTPDGAPAETTAGELGEWCGTGRTGLAFLQVCKAGRTAGRGGFGGVAQQLLNPRGGNLAAVVASTFPLDAEHSTDAAVGFYRQLAAGKPPAEALTADRPETDWCWAFLELWARPGALGGTQHRAAFQFVSPYRGLSSFGEQDADLFFGRTTEVAELLQVLRTEPAVAVVGDSGSGKSSLLQAGLVHAVRRDGLAGSDKWRIVSLRPGYRPVQALLGAILGGTKGGESVRQSTETLRKTIKSALRTADAPLLIVFDQFEEVFTLARNKSEVQMLTDALAEAVEEQRDRFRLVLGMRSEFLGQAASVRGLSRLIRRPWVLRPPGGDDLRDIVAGPAEHCGYTFQGPLADGNPAHAAGLLDRILADPLLARAKGGLTEAPLPLLQFALERLWLKAVEKGVTEFTHAEFDEVGGMGKAIAQHAEAVFQASATATEFGAAGRPLAEQIITSLVSARGTRQPRVRDALQAETGNPDGARAVVDYLVGERLLTIRADPEDMTKSLVDLSHEALIQHWDRLRGWLAEDPQGRAMREEFRKAVEQWEGGFAGVQPRSRHGLPGADVARNYLAWIETSKPKLPPVHQEFTAALRDMLVRQLRRRRLVIVALGVLAFASTGLAVYSDAMAKYARRQEGYARTKEDAANRSLVEAMISEANAQAERRTAEERAAMLALENGIQLCEQARLRRGILAIAYSLQICPPDALDLRRVILTNLAAWGPHLMCLDEVRTFPNAIQATDRAGKYALIRFSKGKDEIVDRVQLFDIDTEKPVGPPVATVWPDKEGRPGLAYEIGWAIVLPNGIVLLTGLGHSSVWDMKSGKQVGATIHHGTDIATLSPDAKLVAASDAEGSTVYLYDVAKGKVLPGKYEHPGRVYDLTFSSDGKLLATGCGRRASAKMDKPPDNKEGANQQIHEGFVHLFDISVDDKSDHRIRARHGMLNPVTCVEISPDQTRLTGGAFELSTWSIPAKGTPAESVLISTRYSLETTVQIAFDPKDNSDFIACNPSGGIQILTGDDAITVKGERLSPQGWVSGTGFRADGRVYTANGYEGIVRIWNRPQKDGTSLVHSKELKPANAGAILSVAFRPDGNALALASKAGLVFVYELRGGAPKLSGVLRCIDDPAVDEFRPVTDVRFSTDGARIIAHDERLNTFVFDANGGPNPIRGKGKLMGVADDGHTAVVEITPNDYRTGQVGSRDDPTTKKLDLGRRYISNPAAEDDDGELQRNSRVAFSPDRSMVAIVDSMGEVHLIRTATGEKVCAPLKHTRIEHDTIRAVTFCPVGETLLTRAPKSRGLWDARTGAPIDMHVSRVGVQITRFSPGGNLVLGGTNFNMAQVWDHTGRELVPVPMMHSAQVWGLAANPVETRIITASFDKTARIWDRATGRPLSPPMLHRLGVSDAAFSPDGKVALTGSWDGTARLWSVPEPLPDDEKRITAWVETMTGMKVGLNVSGELLTADEWLQSKKRLDELGGRLIVINP